MAKRIITKPGNIFCTEIDGKYKCFFQYICNDFEMLNSSVICVFKSRYPIDYNPVLDEIVQDEISFYAHTTIRDGIDNGVWYKLKGTTQLDVNCDLIKQILFGFTKDSSYIDGNLIQVNPTSNWIIWHVNETPQNIGVLTNQYIKKIEYGAVISYIDIVNRIKLGYYTYASPVYDIIKRIPHPDVDSYVKREMDDSLLYQHFLGENAIQEIIIKNGYTKLSEGNPLDRPKFWETNWKHREFVTEEEFKEAWNKYSQQ